MLTQMTDLLGCSIGATDGIVGTVTDLFFDDTAWVIRYLVVKTGSWLSSRHVLISPASLSDIPRRSNVLPADLTMRAVKDSPLIDTDRPVSMQHEMEYLRYYGYALYWSGGNLWGRGAHPGSLRTTAAQENADDAPGAWALDDARADREADAAHRPRSDHHLRSCETVLVYRVECPDGDLGHVHGFLLEDETWAIRYLIVNTSNWWLGGHDVLIAPQWIEAVSWDANKVIVKLRRDQVKSAPPYSHTRPFDRDQELKFHEHYAQLPYWAREVKYENPEMQGGGGRPPLF